MREAGGNLWDFPADARVVTTNGFVKKDGSGVMGRGTALQALRRYPGIDLLLGAQLKTRGNHVAILQADEPQPPGFEYRGVVLSFPVKHNWWERARMLLVERSARELVALCDQHPEWRAVAFPRPGCGNGGMTWDFTGDASGDPYTCGHPGLAPLSLGGDLEAGFVCPSCSVMIGVDYGPVRRVIAPIFDDRFVVVHP